MPGGVVYSIGKRYINRDIDSVLGYVIVSTGLLSCLTGMGHRQLTQMASEIALKTITQTYRKIRSIEVHQLS